MKRKINRYNLYYNIIHIHNIRGVIMLLERRTADRNARVLFYFFFFLTIVEPFFSGQIHIIIYTPKPFSKESIEQ